MARSLFVYLTAYSITSVVAFGLLYFTLFGVLIPFLLKWLNATKRSSPDGDTLLEFPPNGTRKEAAYVFVQWNVFNKARVAELSQIFDDRGGDVVPKRSTWKLMKVTVYNLKLELTEAKKNTKKHEVKKGDLDGAEVVRSGLWRMFAFLGNFIINTGIHIGVMILRHTEVNIHDISIVDSTLSKTMRLEAQDLFLVGQKTGLVDTRLHLGGKSVRVTIDDGLCRQPVVVSVDRGVCISARIRARKRSCIHGGWLGVRNDVHVDIALPSLTVDAIDQRILSFKKLDAWASPGRCRARTDIPTIVEMHGVNPPYASKGFWLQLGSIEGQLLTKKGDLGVAFDAQQSQICVSGLNVGGVPSHHILVRFGISQLRSLECHVDPQIYDQITKQDDESPQTKDAFETLIRHKPKAMLKAGELGVSISTAKKERLVQFLADDALIMTVPKACADLIRELSNSLATATEEKHVETNGTVEKAPQRSTTKSIPLRMQLRTAKVCLLLVTERDTGFAETTGVAIMFADSRGTEFVRIPDRKICGSFTVSHLKNIHFVRCAKKTNVNAKNFAFELSPEKKEYKWGIKLGGSHVIWTTDWQDFFDNVKLIIQPLLDLRKPKDAGKQRQETLTGASNGTVKSEPSTSKFSFKRDCRFFIDGLYLEVEFPDGPKAAFDIGFAEDFCIDDVKMNGRDLYWVLDDTRVAYAKEWEMCNFYLSFKLPVKTVSVSLWKTRIFLPHQFHYGNRWADFWIRLKSYLQGRKALRTPNAPKPKKQFPDLYIKGWDVEATIQDHPLNIFLAKRLPLWRDEAIQRLYRSTIYEERIGELPRSTKWIAEQRLQEQNSKSYIQRVKKVLEREEKDQVQYAPKYPSITNTPIATLGVGTVNFSMFSDEKVVEFGTAEHMRRFKRMDTCNLPSREAQKMDPKNWSELGFRTMKSSLRGVRLKFKDYPTSVLTAVNLDVNGVFGAGKQAVMRPFVSRTRVGLGVKLAADVELPITSMKLFIDALVTSRNIQVAWNQAYMPGLIDFSRSVSRFVVDTREASPRMMSFDMMRMNHHVRLGLEADYLSARFGVAHSPYARIDHYIDLSVSPFRYRLSRFRDMEKPTMVELTHLTIRPRAFRTTAESAICFHQLVFKLDMKFLCTNPLRDPVDHYVQAFPLPGKAVATTFKLVPVTNAITLEALQDKEDKIHWISEIGEIPGWDTFKEWRSRAIDISMGIDLKQGEHPSDQSNTSDIFSEISSIDRLQSDGITTISKTLRLMNAARPAVLGAPRWQDERFKRRPPPVVGIGALTRSTIIEATVQNLRLTLWDNMIPGSALYLQVNSATFHQASGREDHNMEAESALLKRAAAVDDLVVKVKVPGLDIGGVGPDQDEGFFLHARALTFTTIPEKADETDFREISKTTQATKSFASQVRGISEADKEGRGKALEEAESKNKISVKELKFFISPDRRDAIFVYWRMALHEKRFALMKHFSKAFHKKGKRSSALSHQDALGRREKEILEALEKAEEVQESVRFKDLEKMSKATERDGLLNKAAKEVLEFWPVLHLIVDNTQVMFASADTQGTIFLTSSDMELNFNQNKVVSNEDGGLPVDEREWVVSARDTQLYTVAEDKIFWEYGTRWIPDDGPRGEVDAKQIAPIQAITDEPLVLNFMFVSQPGNSDNVEAERVRPSTLYINVPVFSIDTTSEQFMLFRRVISMLNKRMPFATQIQHEISALQYNLLRSLDHIEERELETHALKLKTICQQYEYCLETDTTDFVKNLDPETHDIYKSAIKYLTKSKAFNTFVHKEQYKVLKHTTSQASDHFPSMYFTCSFDKIVWKMNDSYRNAFARLIVMDPVFNRVVYVGRGSSLEFTFTDINIRNMMNGATMSQVLALNLEETDHNILMSTDNRRVAFKWFHIIKESVGGINVYDNVTIKVAPLRVNLTLNIIKALKSFIVPPTDQDKEKVATSNPTEVDPDELEGNLNKKQKEVESMRKRSRQFSFFRYIYIGDVKLVASLKLKDEKKGKLMEFLNAVHVTVKERSLMYSGKLWSWNDFMGEIKQIFNRMKNTAVNQIIRDKLLMGVGPSRRLAQERILEADFDTDLYGSNMSSTVTEEQSSLALSPTTKTPDEKFKEIMFGVGRKVDKRALQTEDD